ncbi:MAG TPA: PilZ domain-containing protein [Pyrinomonadaceae bacterium]|nr:PilZ domain-containing protein [Pyrinomonadaceae bacterium]
MSSDQRQHTRFSLEIPAIIFTKSGERQDTVLQQISVGGCFTGWEENIYTGDEFRMEIQLPNRNRLPLSCRAVYRFENTGVGVKFVDISAFEQSLLSSIIREKLRSEGLPSDVDPFYRPKAFVDTDALPVSRPTPRDSMESILDSIMSGEGNG